MKINLDWLADYVDWSAKFNLDQLLDLINRRLGEIKQVESYREKYAKAQIVEVLQVSKHPQSQRLTVVDLAVGNNQKEQVVCGASNVTAGQLVVWLPPGATVPNSWGKEPVRLTVRSIRGVKSQGMIASGWELDISDDKDNIAIVNDPDLAPSLTDCQLPAPTVGQAFSRWARLDTTVIDIENKMFTHRPDCFGLIGVAREIAAIGQLPFKNPSWYQLPDKHLDSAGSNQQLQVKLECPELVPRLAAVVVDDLTVKPSGFGLVARLSSVGLKPVNNLVDITNYLMYLSAQPSHAFDWHKLLGDGGGDQVVLGARQARSDDSLELLGNKTLRFNHTLKPALITSQDRPVALGGIMGGSQTQVDQTTKRIVLECANFNMDHLWRATMHYGIFSAAATRFSKGQSLAQITPVIQRAAQLLATVGGGRVRGGVCEQGVTHPITPQTIKIDLEFINQRLGTNLKLATVVTTLEAVGIKVEAQTNELIVGVPWWRTDLRIVEDIVEEIGRLTGYENIKPVLPQRAINSVAVNQRLQLNQRLRRLLASNGANEVLAYSFVGRRFLKSAGQDPKLSYSLKNALSPQLKFYRQSLTPSVVELVKANQSAGYKQLVLFELGFSHHLQAPKDDDQLPLDQARLALVFAQGKSDSNNPFYSARHYLDLIAGSYGLRFEYRSFKGPSDPMTVVYNPTTRAQVICQDQSLGVIGLLGSHLAGFEIETDKLIDLIAHQASNYQPLSKYPTSHQDLTLRVAVAVNYDQLLTTLDKTLKRYCQPKKWQFTLEPVSVYYPDDNPAVKHWSWRLRLTALDGTLKASQVTTVIEALVEVATEEHQASQVI